MRLCSFEGEIEAKGLHSSSQPWRAGTFLGRDLSTTLSLGSRAPAGTGSCCSTSSSASSPLGESGLTGEPEAPGNLQSLLPPSYPTPPCSILPCSLRQGLGVLLLRRGLGTQGDQAYLHEHLQIQRTQAYHDWLELGG